MQKLADPLTRAAWMQFLRMPMNFDLVAEIMSELDSHDVSQSQTEIMRRFVAHRFSQKGMTLVEASDATSVLERIAVKLLDGGAAGRSREFSARDAAPANTDESTIKSFEERLAKIESTGLIRANGNGRYRFFHLNLQDYFTAAGLTDLALIDPRQTAWRQIILFYAGGSKGNGVLPVIDTAAAKQASPYLDELRGQVTTIRAAASPQPDI